MTGRIARALMDIPEGRERFRVRLVELVCSFDGKEISARASVIATRLIPNLSRSDYSEFGDSLSDLRERILARGLFLRRDLILTRNDK